MISGMTGNTPSDIITLVGTDDGKSFWTVQGKFISKVRGTLSVDFSSKGGPDNVSGTFKDGQIVWFDGNVWSQQAVSKYTVAEFPPFNATEIDGVYTDSVHYKEGSMAGIRMITAKKGTTPSKDLTLVGTDDGKSWWTVHGVLGGTNAKNADVIFVDFSPLGGPSKVKGIYKNGRIRWPDGNIFTKQAVADAFKVPPDPGKDEVGGLYGDPNHYCKGSFVGMRIISPLPGYGFIIVGTDDGRCFWTVTGNFTSKAKRALVVDFSPKGGPQNACGTYKDGEIIWFKGPFTDNVWSRYGISKSLEAPYYGNMDDDLEEKEDLKDKETDEIEAELQKLHLELMSRLECERKAAKAQPPPKSGFSEWLGSLVGCGTCAKREYQPNQDSASSSEY